MEELNWMDQQNLEEVVAVANRRYEVFEKSAETNFKEALWSLDMRLGEYKTVELSDNRFLRVAVVSAPRWISSRVSGNMLRGSTKKYLGAEVRLTIVGERNPTSVIAEASLPVILHDLWSQRLLPGCEYEPYLKESLYCLPEYSLHRFALIHALSGLVDRHGALPFRSRSVSEDSKPEDIITAQLISFLTSAIVASSHWVRNLTLDPNHAVQ